MNNDVAAYQCLCSSSSLQCRDISVLDHLGILLDVTASSSIAMAYQYLCSKILVSMPWHIVECRGMPYSAALCLFFVGFLLNFGSDSAHMHPMIDLIIKMNIKSFRTLIYHKNNTKTQKT